MTSVAALPAFGQAATSLSVDAPRTILAGDTPLIRVLVTFPGDCSSTPPLNEGRVTINIAGQVGSIAGDVGASRRVCSQGSYTDSADVVIFPGATAGDYVYNVQYSGITGFAPASLTGVPLTVVPYLGGPLANGNAKLSVVRGDLSFFCASHEAAFDASTPGDAPTTLKSSLGQVRYSFTNCGFECGFLCWAHAPRFPMETIAIETAQPLPPDASVWVHATGSGMTTPVWRHVPATVDGSKLTFTLTGNDDDRTLAGTLVIASDSAAARSDLQDLWWGGSAQNGWGLNISQQGDRIFGALYAYRADGSPVWLVMPGGTWDAAHTVFTGTLYGATGSSYLQYDASRLNVAPSGNAKLAFAGTGTATFDYTIGSESGRKILARQPIGSTAQPTQGPYAGLWWGGSAQNGWGISIAHQDDTLFAVWYTYDASGSATWYVMPGGSWTTSVHSPNHSAYSGKLYRTSGSPFLGGTYDPSKLVVTAVGTMGFEFFGTDLAYMGYTIDGHTGYQTVYRQPF